MQSHQYLRASQPSAPAVPEWESANAYNQKSVVPSTGHQKRAALAPINQTGVIHRYIVAPLKNTVKSLNERKDKARRFEDDESQADICANGIIATSTGSLENYPGIENGSYYSAARSDHVMHSLSTRFDTLHVRQLSKPALTMSSLPDAAITSILKKLNFKQHMTARLVCKQWNRLSADLNMQPVDEITQLYDVMQVVEYSQEIVTNLLEQEAGLWTPAKVSQMQTALNSQVEVTTEMRRVLVDWLIEVHFKFRLKPQTLYTAISLVNRILFSGPISRKDIQTIGVSSVMVAAKFEERFSPSITDLVYITSQSSTKQKIVEKEREILKIINFELVLPSCWSFINRFAKVIGLSKDETLMANYLIDLTLPEVAFVYVKPSLIVIAAMCLVRSMQSKQVWNDRTAFYSQHTEEEVVATASQIFQVAKHTKSTSVPKKYKTPTYGGVTPAIQELLASTHSFPHF